MPAMARKPIGVTKSVHTIVLYQGSDCLGVTYVVPRKRTLIGIVLQQFSVKSKNLIKPTTGSGHQADWSANSTIAPMISPKTSVMTAGRLRYKAAQTTNGRGRNQPVNLVAAAQPKTTPKSAVNR